MAQTLTPQQLEELQGTANAIRRHIVSMVTEAKSGHPGGSLSAADMVATLFFAEMRIFGPLASLPVAQ